MLVYNYLMLDKDDITKICGVISRKEVLKEIGMPALKKHLVNGLEFPFRGKYVLVEEDDHIVEDGFEEVKISEGKRGTYYASRKGEFFIKYKGGATHYLSKYMNHYKGYVAVSVNRSSYCAKNLIAKLFIKGYKPGDIVIQKNGDVFDCRVENLKVIPKKLYAKKTYGLIGAKPVGLYENNRLVRTWPSARKCAKDMYCSYQMIMDACNNKWQRKEYDVRWI